MPWTSSDATRHTKKADSPDKQKRWAATANGVLKSCLASGGDQGTCEAKAIRIANSKMEEPIMPDEIRKDISKQSMKCPSSALHFSNYGDLLVQFKEVGEGQMEPRLKMTAYSGGAIMNHFFWGNLVIDTKGVKFSREKYPILRNHDTDKPIAFTDKPIIDNGQIVIDPDKTTFVDTDHAKDFIKLSSQGFPFQSSIYAKPTSITKFDRPSKVSLNGQEFEDINTVWNECEFKEASVCVFGYDSNTQSAAFEEGEIEVKVEETHKQESEVIEMDKIESVQQFKDEYPELAKQFADEVAESEKTKSDSSKQENEALAQGMKDLGAKVTALETENKSLKSTIAKFSEKEQAEAVEKIWASKLSESSLPESVYSKVKLLVSESKYRKEDGSLDTDAFSAAVDKEITEWEEAGVSTQVMGFGTSRKVEESTAEKDVSKTVDELASRLDQKTLKKS